MLMHLHGTPLVEHNHLQSTRESTSTRKGNQEWATHTFKPWSIAKTFGFRNFQILPKVYSMLEGLSATYFFFLFAVKHYKSMEVKIESIIPSEVRTIGNLVECLAREIDAKNQKLEEMECKYNEISVSLRKAVEEKDALYQNYTEEMRRMQCVLHDHSLRVPQEIEKFKSVLDSRMEELAKRASELKKREMQNDFDRKKLIIEKRKNAMTSQSLQTTMLEQKEAYEYGLRVLEDERNVMKIQTLRMGILERKRSCEYALRTIEDRQCIGEDENLKIDAMRETISNLEEKEGELEHLEDLSQSLIAKERKSNDEMQEARKELIDGLKEISDCTSIGVKRMGELDVNPFQNACRQKYPIGEADVKSLELCSLWDDYLRNPNWHPFKIITVAGKSQEIIDYEDEKLNGLKNELGEVVYRAVTTALMEINDYNPSGRFIIPELWNFREGKRATLKEAISFLLGQLKSTLKRKR
ncbi:hypothetical protein GIB67_040500 [Kingdonia uniflora]|uniref:Factor of DNA methylation 1-5/IDN2 domain-containing protein n=1 Tax=Kingdonia uniflora TaxID=39325 RepID=A0A7J7L5E6_9MAGN|nr:hypothetical protein GIB67_040500 [Kingdonia uniflora]